jgi:putative transposase
MHLIATGANASVSAVCRALEVPRSTYYARRGRKPSERDVDTEKLDVEIKAVFKEHKGRYGSPRIYRAVRATRAVSRKRIAARMRVLKLRARRPKRFRRTTESDPSKVPAPNILARRFKWERPNEAWVGDITYIWTRAGWAYLAIMVDLCTRSIVGWSTSKRCDAALALDALNNAVARHRPGDGLLHHTDRGSTYTASDYQARLDELGMVKSMSRKGNCWDNAVAEATIGTIKVELFGDHIPEDIHEVQRELFQYIEAYYNRVRMHSTLGYRAPAELEHVTPARGARAA